MPYVYNLLFGAILHFLAIFYSFIRQNIFKIPTLLVLFSFYVLFFPCSCHFNKYWRKVSRFFLQKKCYLRALFNENLKKGGTNCSLYTISIFKISLLSRNFLLHLFSSLFQGLQYGIFFRNIKFKGRCRWENTPKFIRA